MDATDWDAELLLFLVPKGAFSSLNLLMVLLEEEMRCILIESAHQGNQ